MVSAYTAKPEKATVEALAIKLGKSVKSIVAKLVREKVYVKPTTVSKSGEPVVKKSELVDKLCDLVPLTEAESTSFEHVNKTALQKLIKALSPKVTM
jgi:hypothetical protein